MKTGLKLKYSIMPLVSNHRWNMAVKMNKIENAENVD